MGKRTGKPNGRPTKLTSERHDALVKAASNGTPWEIACFSATIQYQTLLNWVKRGGNDLEEGDDTVYARFFEAFARALGKWAADRWREAGDAANGAEAQPIQWQLLTRFPVLHPKNRTEFSGPGGGPIQVTPDMARIQAAFEQMSEEERKVAAETGRLPPHIGED